MNCSSIRSEATEKWCNITNKLIDKYKHMTEDDPKRAFTELTQIEGALLAGGFLTKEELESLYSMRVDYKAKEETVVYGPNPNTNIYRILNSKVSELTIINKFHEGYTFLIDTKYVDKLKECSWSYSAGSTSPITTSKKAWRKLIDRDTNEEYIQKNVSMKVFLFDDAKRIKGENPYDHREECFEYGM